MLKRKKFFALILSVLMLFLLRSSVAFAAYYDDNTGDSWDDAYIIDSVEDLKLMNDRYYITTDIGKYYKLASNIDLTSETDWSPTIFQGHFDGQGHTISVNIDLSSSSTSHASLFGNVSSDSEAIKNLVVTGTLRSSYVSAGITDALANGSITDCQFTGTIETTGDVAYAGGIAGIIAGVYGGNPVIKNCTFSGTISAISQKTSGGSATAGGITVSMTDIAAATGGSSNNPPIIENCNVLSGTSVTVSAPALEIAGGIIGQMVGGKVTGCTSNATVTAKTWAGGIVGLASSSSTSNTYTMENLSNNTWPTQYNQAGNDSNNANNNTGNTGNQTQQENARLHVAMVEEVPEDYKTEDLLQKLAKNVSTDRSKIQWLPADAIDTSEPPEPTQSMRDQVAKDSYQFAAKLNTLKVSEDGYYVFQVTVSDDLVGTKASDLKLYYADEDEFSGSSASLAFFGLMPAINGITGSLEVSNMLGVKLDTLPKQFLATMFLSASKSITVYIVRILLLLLGGCNVGIGIAGVLVIGVVAVKFFRKRK